MTKLQELKKEIQRLRPEILELKFGCEVSQRIKGRDEIFRVIGSEHYGEPVIEVIGLNGLIPVRFFTVLGRPIILEDVIICLSKLADIYKGVEYPSGSYWLGAMILRLISEYKLGKPLDDQLEETINFLHSIICK